MADSAERCPANYTRPSPCLGAHGRHHCATRPAFECSRPRRLCHRVRDRIGEILAGLSACMVRKKRSLRCSPGGPMVSSRGHQPPEASAQTYEPRRGDGRRRHSRSIVSPIGRSGGGRIAPQNDHHRPSGAGRVGKPRTGGWCPRLLTCALTGLHFRRFQAANSVMHPCHTIWFLKRGTAVSAVDWRRRATGLQTSFAKCDRAISEMLDRAGGSLQQRPGGPPRRQRVGYVRARASLPNVIRGLEGAG